MSIKRILIEKKIKDLQKNYCLPYNKARLRNLLEKRPDRLSKTEKAYTQKLALKFKELVIARNELAQACGKKNYFDFIADWDAIPARELQYFYDHAPQITQSTTYPGKLTRRIGLTAADTTSH